MIGSTLEPERQAVWVLDVATERVSAVGTLFRFPGLECLRVDGGMINLSDCLMAPMDRGQHRRVELASLGASRSDLSGGPWFEMG